MIKTRLINETDAPPFLAVCESTNGHLLTIRVTELDYPARRIKAEIIDGWPSEGMQTGTVREFFPYGMWRKIYSTKAP